MKEKIFVSNVNGAQGTAISHQLIEKGYDVVSLTTKDKTPSIDHLSFVKGSLENKADISLALKGVKKAVYTLPLLFDINVAKVFTSNFIEAAKEHDIELIVFNTGFDLPINKTGLLALDLKIALQELFTQSGLHVITIMPDIYLDNLVAPWALPLILEKGILPYPIESGVKVPWISHTDLGRFVSSAVEKPELAGQTLSIGGSLFTGEEIAETISIKIKRAVQFIPVTPNDFESELKGSFGELAAREISNLYRYVKDNREALIKKDFKQAQSLLNVTPEPLSDWVDSL